MDTTKNKILEIIKKQGEVKSSLLVGRLNLTRQTVSKHLKTLVQSGVIEKKGSTKSSIYYFSNKKSQLKPVETKIIKKIRNSLQEHKVYEELELRLNLNKHLNKNASTICFYAFGEMLNNAIDHSESKKVEVKASIVDGNFQFSIKDFGVGVFYNIKEYYDLEDEYESVNWLLSGKKTSMPSRHSGEGIFFTSKISDKFSLKSHNLNLTINNKKENTNLKKIHKVKGTEVLFKINANTKKKLNSVFESYTNKDFEFDKSKSRVKIISNQSAISRSQAKKMLASVGDFNRIELDFEGINEIGQAFCDEVFRVYQQRNPKKIISWTNASDVIEFMIRRSLKETD